MCSLVPSPPPPPQEKRRRSSLASNSPQRGKGRVRLHVGYLGIPAIFQLVCHAFLSAFSGYSRSVEAHNCRSDRRETGTQIGHIGKIENRIGYQIRKPVTIFRGNRKPYANNRKSANRNEHQNGKTEVFWHKNRKTDLKNSQNRKTENPNASLYTSNTG